MLGIPETIWQALIAAVVTISLALIQRNTNRKVDKLVAESKDIHTLVNSNYGIQLKIGALALKRVAKYSKDPTDANAAEVAEQSLADHNRAQEKVNSNNEVTN